MPRPLALCDRAWIHAVIVVTVLGSALRASAQEEAAAPAATDNPVEMYQQAYAAGAAALEKKEYEAAVEAFTRAIKISDFAPEPYAGRGEAMAGLKEYDAADKDFGEALSKNPDYVPALVARGEMRLELGANDLALSDFQLALEHERSNTRALFGLGKAHVLLNRGDLGLKPLTRHLEAKDQPDEKRAEAFRLRAQANGAVGKFQEAMQDIQESLKLKPDDYETYAILSILLFRQQDYLGAIKAITESITKYVPDEENPQPYVQGYLTKVSILAELAKRVPSEDVRYQVYDAAIFDCNQLLMQLGDAPQYAAARSAVLYSRGVALRLQGRYEFAIDSLSESLKLNPESGEAYFRRGICFFNIDEGQLALADFQKSAVINVEDPRAHLWEGFTYAKMGEFYEAIRAYGQAIALSDRYVPAFINRGLVYMQLGQFEKAIEDFNEAILLEPEAAAHYFKRGVAYVELGEQQKAADSFATAIECNPRYVPAYRYMADSMTALGLNSLAEQYRTKADELEAAAEALEPAADESEPAAESQG